MIYNLKKKIKEILKEKENSSFEADIIISSVTKLKKIDLLFEKEISLKQAKKCIKLAKKRKKNVPLQYLIKNWEFYGVFVLVGKGVLIPRQDTEILVDLALKFAKKDSKILDLGTGSGCISKAIAKNKKNVKIVAVEKYNKALKYAKKNLKNLKKTVTLIKGDILKKKLAEKFKDIDLIVSNPPYLTKKDMLNLQKEVKFEPKNALYGGKNGLKFYEKICLIWKNSLKKDARIIFEIGAYQEKQITNILKKNGFLNITTYKDLTGKNRAIVAKK